MIEKQMFEFIEDLFPICRSITGPGQRETLNYIKNILPTSILIACVIRHTFIDLRIGGNEK